MNINPSFAHLERLRQEMGAPLVKWSIVRDRYNVENLADSITKAQVLEIIHEHGFSAERFGWTAPADDVVKIFDEEIGDRESYDTVSIFHWLGY